RGRASRRAAEADGAAAGRRAVAPLDVGRVMHAAGVAWIGFGAARIGEGGDGDHARRRTAGGRGREAARRDDGRMGHGGRAGRGGVGGTFVVDGDGDRVRPFFAVEVRATDGENARTAVEGDRGAGRRVAVAPGDVGRVVIVNGPGRVAGVRLGAARIGERGDILSSR